MLFLLLYVTRKLQLALHACQANMLRADKPAQFACEGPCFPHEHVVLQATNFALGVQNVGSLLLHAWRLPWQTA